MPDLGVVQKMITRNEIVGAILDACPSFKPGYAALCADGDAELTYIVLGRFAYHLVELHQTGSEAEFFDVAELIERMHAEGDEYVREAATIGLLEGIQNYSGVSELDLVYFRSILRPESQRWWDSINKFWQKEIPFVGADLQTENPMHNKSAHPTAGNVLL